MGNMLLADPTGSSKAPFASDGSQGFAAPEMARGWHDRSVDIYAFGVILSALT